MQIKESLISLIIWNIQRFKKHSYEIYYLQINLVEANSLSLAHSATNPQNLSTNNLLY